MNDINLASPSQIKSILETYGFEFSKSLGQNFLIDQNIIDKIIAHSQIDQDTNVLEIGPGLGAMTKSLAKEAKKILAVEIDESLKPIHQDLLGHIDNLDIIYKDILELDLKEVQNQYFKGEDFKIVANLPYYITSPIITKLLKSDCGAKELVVMMQKEVADRIVAKKDSKEYGSLTVFIDYFASSKILFKVPPTVFMPRPKVDSAVVRIKLKEKIDYELSKELEKLIKAAFNQRRKTILNSLSASLNIDKGDLKEIFHDTNIDPGLRAENLSLDDYLKILARIKEGDKIDR